MKKLTIQFICLAMVIMAISVTETFAQRVRLKNGKATVRAKVKANGKKTYTISGKDFKKLKIKQTRGGKFKYEIRRGSEFLSSGHTTGIKTIKSDGRSVYSITIFSNKSKLTPIVLSLEDLEAQDK